MKLYTITSLVILVLSEGHTQEKEEPLKTLNDDTFEHLTQAATGATTGDWLVVFSATDNKCPDCSQSIKVFEELAYRLYKRMNIAKVDTDVNKLLVRRFKISKFPTIILFRFGFQFQYYGELKLDKLQSFVEGGYRDSRKQAVMQPPSTFDMLLEDTLDELRLAIKERKLASGAMITIGAIFGILFLSILLCCCGSQGTSDEDAKRKEKKDS